MIFILFLLFPLNVSADFSCLQIFAKQPDFALPSLEILFSETPHLLARVKHFLNEKGIPATLKKQLWDVLETNELQIYDFSPPLKRKYGFSFQIDAFMHDSGTPYQVVKQTWSNFNDELSEPFERLKRDSTFLPKRFFVFINDSTFSPSNHALLDFIHELAHIRMILFLEKNLRSFVGKFPSDFLSVDPFNNEILVNSHFYSYIQERFAHEEELAAYLIMRFYSHLLGDSAGKWSGFSDSEESRTRLARQIRSNYKLRDERLAYFDRMPLDRIFQQGLDPKLWDLGK